MNCTRRHRLIALVVGGDLDPRRTSEVEKHLEGCLACRGLAQELSADLESMALLDARAAGDLDLGSVRAAVQAEVADRRRPFVPFFAQPRFAVAAVGVVGVIAVLSIFLSDGGEREPTLARDILQAPVGEEQIEIPDVEPDRPHEPALEPANEEFPVPVQESPLRLADTGRSTVRTASISPPAPTEPMTVKILTDDPDVVIYWIVDS